jgi:cytochrome P450
MTLPVLDLRAAGFWQDPFPLLDDLRERGAVALTHDGGKLVLRHAEVGELLLGGQFENEGASLLARRGFKPGDALYDYRMQALGALNGPAHLRIRALVGKALGLHFVREIRGIVEQRLDALLQPLAGRDIDALPALANRLPLEVIGEYLGIAESDRAGVDHLVREGQARAFGREVTAETVARANRLFAELLAFVGDQVRHRRMRPRNDLLSRLLDADEGGSRLSQDEAVVLFLNLFIGAVESTASAIASGLLLLARQPGLLDEVRAQGAAAFVEENLRLYPPNTLLANKVAKQDTEFHGLRLAAGEPVIVPIPAPNRDPRVFQRPNEVDLRRPPARHYSFSLGTHFCLGQALARTQLQAGFERLARRLRRVVLLEQRIEWEPYAAITRMRSLRLRLEE